MQKIIIASGPVIVEDNKVLLDQQGNDDFWKFCGGKTREGENLRETAIRRSKEELGIDIELTSAAPFISYIQKEIDGQPTDIVLVHFLAKRKTEITPGDEVLQWSWFNVNDVENMLVGPNIVPALRHFGFIKD